MEEGPARIQELIDWGTSFDQEGGKLAFGREAAHTRDRTLHAGGVSTGQEIHRALIRKVRSLNSVHLMRDSFVLDLLMEAGKYRGVACNGVHGANRLASNSLKEKVIFEALPINQELGSQQSIDPVTIS